MPNRTKAKRRTTNASAATAVAARVRVIQRRAGVAAAEPRQRRTASSPPQGKRRMPGTTTGLDALVFRRKLLTVYEAAVVVSYPQGTPNARHRAPRVRGPRATTVARAPSCAVCTAASALRDWLAAPTAVAR